MTDRLLPRRLPWPDQPQAWRRLALATLLTGLAVLGNLAAVPLFFGIQILLGSIVATLTLLVRRGWWNVAITLVASLCTVALWGHPWAIVIFGGEALWLALFVNRFNGPPANDLNGRIILVAIAYWLLVGIPLVFLLYGGVLQFDAANVQVSAAKQALNGVANTVVAFLLFVLLQIRRSRGPRGLVPLRGLVFSLVLSSIAIPSLILTLITGHQLQTATLEGVRENLLTLSEAAARIVPARLGDPSRGLPASIGAVSFLRRDDDGTRFSSNPELFARLNRDFRPAGTGRTEPEGLRILIPKRSQPLLRTWVQGYWSTTARFVGTTVDAVQPARPEVLTLQAQSTTLLNSLNVVLVVGTLLSELVAGLLEGQFRLIRSRPVDEGPAGRTLPPHHDSVIAEIHQLADRLNMQIAAEGRLRQERDALQQQLSATSRELRQLASIDPLTGVLRRSELEGSLASIILRARDCAVPVSCLAFAIRGLRPINASLGRTAGDGVLRDLISEVRGLLHANDTMVRLGGAEFLVVLWDQPLESARTLAERIRDRVTATPVPLETVAGVSLLLASDADGQALIARVEQALHQARLPGASQPVTR